MAPFDSNVLKLAPDAGTPAYRSAPHHIAAEQSLLGAILRNNAAVDAPVVCAPRAQIEAAERRLYELAESGRYDGGFQRFAQALTVAVDMAAKAFQRDGKLSGIATGLRDLDTKMGGLQSSDLIIVAGRPGMGKTALATNIAYNVAKAHRAEVQADGTMKSINGGILGFFSCETP